jgi:hypothetical protein
MLGNDKQQITLKKGNCSMKFDKIINTKTGSVVGATIVPRKEGQTSTKTTKTKPTTVATTNTSNTHGLTATRNKSYRAEALHHILGHQSSDTARKTAKYYDFKLTGTMPVCEDCALTKARQTNLGHATKEDRVTTICERLDFDISSIASESIGGAKFWLLVIDPVTEYIWSYFLKRKNQLADKLVQLIKRLNAVHGGITVKRVRCDNAPEINKRKNNARRKHWI